MIFLVLDSITLQLNIDSWSFLLATLFAGVGIMVSIFFEVNATKRETEARYADIITNLGNELDNVLNKEFDLKNDFECEIYAERYLDSLDRIAFLEANESVPSYTIDYFKKYFRYGKTLYDWYSNNVKDNEETLSDHWLHFEQWVSNNHIEKYNDVYLPPAIRNYKKNEQQAPAGEDQKSEKTLPE